MLPEEIGYLRGPCMVQVNSSISAMTGGNRVSVPEQDIFYLYNHDIEEWIIMPPMQTGKG